MRRCPTHGIIQRSSAKFCPDCGAPTAAAYSADDKSDKKSKSENSRDLIIGVIVAAFIALLFVPMFLNASGQRKAARLNRESAKELPAPWRMLYNTLDEMTTCTTMLNTLKTHCSENSMPGLTADQVEVMANVFAAPRGTSMSSCSDSSRSEAFRIISKHLSNSGP